EFGTAPIQVHFDTADRCSATGTACDQTNQSNWGNWPDTPWDQNCDTGHSCPDQTAPTFWSSQRLATVTTRVWGGAGYRDVDQWSLRADWPDPNDGTHAGLWLAGIIHTGLAGGNIPLPETQLTPAVLDNRVDATNDNIYAHAWPRLVGIRTETGALINIT